MRFEQTRERLHVRLNERAFDAIVNHDVRRLTWCFRLGAHPNMRDAQGRSMLGFALAFLDDGVDDLIEVLLTHGADVNAPLTIDPKGYALANPQGWGPDCALHAAVRGISLPTVELLGRYGADPNRLANGVSPLLVRNLTQPGGLAIVRALLAMGADPRIPDDEGRCFSERWPRHHVINGNDDAQTVWRLLEDARRRLIEREGDELRRLVHATLTQDHDAPTTTVLPHAGRPRL